MDIVGALVWLRIGSLLEQEIIENTANYTWDNLLIIIGIVISTKCAKSITVQYQHPKFISKYNATISTRRKVMAHDEDEICEDGDLVRVVPCRPMSRKKRHKIIDIIRKAKKFDYENINKSQWMI